MVNLLRKNKKILYFFQSIKCLATGRKATFRKPSCFKEKEEVITITRGDITQLNSIPQIVWIYWEDPNIPDYIQGIIEHNRSINLHWEFRILNATTYRQYLPDIDFQRNMPIANKTDVIRLELLYRFGGLWMDATIILRDDLSWIVEVSEKQPLDLIGFYRNNDTIDFNYPVIETYFIASPKNSIFIKKWLMEFREIIVLGNKQYFENIKTRLDYHEIRQKIPNPSYLLVYLAGQISFRNSLNCQLYLKKAEDSALLLQEHYNTNYMMNYAICRMKSPLCRISMIKLCSGDRMFVPMYKKLGLVKEDSLVGSFIAPRRSDAT